MPDELSHNDLIKQVNGSVEDLVSLKESGQRMIDRLSDVAHSGAKEIYEYFKELHYSDWFGVTINNNENVQSMHVKLKVVYKDHVKLGIVVIPPKNKKEAEKKFQSNNFDKSWRLTKDGVCIYDEDKPYKLMEMDSYTADAIVSLTDNKELLLKDLATKLEFQNTSNNNNQSKT